MFVEQKQQICSVVNLMFHGRREREQVGIERNPERKQRETKGGEVTTNKCLSTLEKR